MRVNSSEFGCIVSNFYIKSQQITVALEKIGGCIVSNFYIKSQLPGILGYSP